MTDISPSTALAFQNVDLTKAEIAPTQEIQGYSAARIEDAASQAAMQPWIAMECYQLSPGKQLTQMETLDLGRQQVVRETQLAAVHKLGMTPPGLCTLSCSTPNPSFRFSELAACDNTVFFMPERTEFDIFVPAGTQTTYISFDYDAFLQGAQALDPASWEQPQQILPIYNGQQPALMSIATQWLQRSQALVAEAAISAQDVNNQMLQQLLHIATASSGDHASPSQAERAQAYVICRKAREYIDSCFSLDIVPAISAICTAVSVSERSLQYAFRTYVNMSPLAYLRSCRLCRVRSLLRYSSATSTTVTAVAMRFGFLHLSRFARDYKQAFGELPSATLELPL